MALSSSQHFNVPSPTLLQKTLVPDFGDFIGFLQLEAFHYSRRATDSDDPGGFGTFKWLGGISDDFAAIDFCDFLAFFGWDR